MTEEKKENPTSLTKPRLMLISPMLHQGGFERVCVTTARLLAPYFDVTIVIFNSADIAYDVEGLSIIDIQLGVKKGKLKKLLNILRRAGRVRKLKKELQPVIAYSFGPTANLVNALSRTGKEKVWLGLRNYTDVEEKNKIRLFIRLADLMICCSKEIELVLREQFGFFKTAVLYNLYDGETIRQQAQEGEPELPFGETDEKGRRLRFLVSMGRDDDMKGFWHMLKAFSLIHGQMPETRLLLLGAGTFADYKELAEKLQVADAVCFAGMQREPYRYLKKGEVYLLTSLNEGFPNALVEGMTLGLASVCVNCQSGPAEILMKDSDTLRMAELLAEKEQKQEKPVIYGDYGILLPWMSREKNLDPEVISKEEELLAETVLTLLQDEALLTRYREAAVLRARCFTYENYVASFLKLASLPVESTGEL